MYSVPPAHPCRGRTRRWRRTSQDSRMRPDPPFEMRGTLGCRAFCFAEPGRPYGLVNNLALKSQNLLRIAAGERGAGCVVETFDRIDVTDGVIFQHVEGIIRAQHDAVGAIG